jgi:hypothetical protein
MFSKEYMQGVDYGEGFYFTSSKQEAFTYATNHNSHGYLYEISADVNSSFDVRNEILAKALTKKLKLSWLKVKNNKCYKDLDTGMTDADADNYYAKIVDEYYNLYPNKKYYEVKEYINYIIRQEYDSIYDTKRQWLVLFDERSIHIINKTIALILAA